MCLQLIDIYTKACFISFYQWQNNLGSGNTPQTHANKVKDTDIDTGSHGRNPKANRYKIQEQNYNENSQNNYEATAKNKL
ncbi:hypothetical protein SDC9_108545 [bioreactor metagenome]|uniref:Uncharacterized protein n=1 Tax=bioreactor metagenome TaxID=1076179 RepID=A0A645B8E4_9ZZZZ